MAQITTSEPQRYVPILRWKAAEKEALGLLSFKDKDLMTPLIELIMPQPKSDKKLLGENLVQKTLSELREESIASFHKSLQKVPEDILKYWGQNPIFIDLHLIDGSIRAKALEAILSLGEKLDLFMIPVINMIPVVDFDSDVETREAAINFAKVSKRGLCLRLFRSDLSRNALPKNIEVFLKKSALAKEDVDLLVDFQITDEQYPILENLLKHLPELSKWRTFTLASGAFPPDLTQFEHPDKYEIPRSDWIRWSNLVKGKNLERHPSFSDYTIQHPIYRDPIRGANPSASIRYTINDKWIIMRGRGLRSPKSAGHAQYPAHANLLLNTDEFKLFGESFSYGDAYIGRIGRDVRNKETGSPRTWLRAGINHHLACVVSQIANLP